MRRWLLLQIYQQMHYLVGPKNAGTTLLATSGFVDRPVSRQIQGYRVDDTSADVGDANDLGLAYP